MKAGSSALTRAQVARARLSNQHIARPGFDAPADVVRWLGAVQAQDYLGSLWAIGLRMRAPAEARIEQAIADKSIIRTWPMRGTLHWVAASDARWLLGLLAPRIESLDRSRLTQLGLDNAALSRSRKALTKALQGGRILERSAVYEVLEQARVPTREQRGIHIIGRLAREALICFGPRAGKQPTFALFDEWLPQAAPMPRAEALAELARRYFTSHGPATLQDFVWWSSLPAGDARAGLQSVSAELMQRAGADGQTYWMSPEARAADVSPNVFLLPPFDEYIVAYKDRSAILKQHHATRATSGGVFYPAIIINGQLLGTWRRTMKKDTVIIAPEPFEQLTTAAERSLARAARRYGEFLRMQAIVG